MRCAAITKAGERCKLDATSGSYCWSHAPENAAQRKAKARRGGKARGASEMAEVKREIRRVIEAVDRGQTERGVGAVLFQGFNTLLKAIETERRIREMEDIEARLEELEREMGHEEYERGAYG
ncbi:MAG: hypothetical protein M3441_27210 [Chloroflexota bacterium]|nr:hypothetical protein [Chloroflexota bacterium]